MVSVHELAQSAVDPTVTHLELVPRRQQVDRIVLIRCPSCKGLRGSFARHRTRQERMCKDCLDGNVIPRKSFMGFWLELFTDDEIEEMAVAIWG